MKIGRINQFCLPRLISGKSSSSHKMKNFQYRTEKLSMKTEILFSVGLTLSLITLCKYELLLWFKKSRYWKAIQRKILCDSKVLVNKKRVIDKAYANWIWSFDFKQVHYFEQISLSPNLTIKLILGVRDACLQSKISQNNKKVMEKACKKWFFKKKVFQIKIPESYN